MERHRRQGRDLVQQQSRDRALAPRQVVIGVEVRRREQQLAQQRGDVDDGARARPPGHRVRLDVQAPGADPEHPHAVPGARRDEDGALGRHRPRSVAGLHDHHAGGAVQELGPPVLVPVQQLPVRVVGPDREDGPRYLVDFLERHVPHVISLVADSRRNTAALRLPATTGSCWTGDP
jgi:hypothetical protein